VASRPSHPSGLAHPPGFALRPVNDVLPPSVAGVAPVAAPAAAGRGDSARLGFHPRPMFDRNLPTFAALDLGTNNCRLLVAQPAPGGFVVIDAFSRIVRLGEGLSSTRRLSEAAIDRTLAALKVCAGKVRRRQAEHSLRAVATEACRQADNCRGFLDRVEAEVGLRFEIITPAEEARLAVSSCAPLLDATVPHGLVFDIGGGSTEVTWLRMVDGLPQVIDHVSVPLGVVALSEQYGTDSVSRGQFRAMVDAFTGPLEAFDARNAIRPHVQAGRVQMVGTSGTVTTLAGLNMHLPRYNRAAIDGSWLRFKAARRVTRELMGLNQVQRAAHPCIGRDRADLVLPGCAVLEAICRTWPVGRLRVADRGLREGILFELIARSGAAIPALPTLTTSESLAALGLSTQFLPA
jgi:exopolyphosphatase / guanosine-5'-triphosphate,3'-diphosphate pyrophosphatase